MSLRFEQLDSLRGLASFSVVLTHCFGIFPAVFEGHFGNSAARLVMFSPLRIFCAGHEAVIFFFVLSGFVLALPFLKGPVAYVPYAIKRICRIYVPYIVAVLIAALFCRLLSTGEIPGYSTWFNSIWNINNWPALLTQHFILIGNFPNGKIIPVLWSLVLEMRISLIFPLIMLLVMRTSWRVSLTVAIAISVVGYSILLATNAHPSIQTDYPNTLVYLCMFVVGALLAKHRTLLIMLFTSLSKRRKVVLLLIAVLLYTYRWWCFPNVKIIHIDLLETYLITVGVVIFILVSLSSKTVTKFLVSTPLLNLGRCSYSLYLYHAVVLLSLIHLLHGRWPIYLILGVTVILSLVISWIAFLLIEKPSMILGKRIAAKFAPMASPQEAALPSLRITILK